MKPLEVKVFGSLGHKQFGELDIILTANVEPDEPAAPYSPAHIGAVCFGDVVTVDGGIHDTMKLPLDEFLDDEERMSELEDQARETASDEIEDNRE